MKKLFVAIFIFTALTFLALPMGDLAQSQPASEDVATFMGQYVKVNMIKGFAKDDRAWDKVKEKKNNDPNKIYGEMTIEGPSGDKINIAFSNPCTTVCVGTRCYSKCY